MATSRNLYTNQLSNRNFLSSVGFRFTLSRARKVSFLSNSANIPGLQLGVAEQPNYLKNIDLPGDKMFFDDFVLRFIVDDFSYYVSKLFKFCNTKGITCPFIQNNIL